MRFNKNIQYGMLFCLYLCRSGRVTVDSAAEGLGLSKTLLSQVANKLKAGGVVKSVKGPQGGYELAEAPKVIDVFNALSPIKLIDTKEATKYVTGDAEHRALMTFVRGFNSSISPLMQRTIRGIGNDLVLAELNILDNGTAALS